MVTWVYLLGSLNSLEVEEHMGFGRVVVLVPPSAPSTLHLFSQILFSNTAGVQLFSSFSYV